LRPSRGFGRPLYRHGLFNATTRYREPYGSGGLPRRGGILDVVGVEAHHRRDDGQGQLCDHHRGHGGSRRRFERLQAGDAEVVQEPTEQPYGVRDCAVRDPAGNLIRINELR
jgi:catechol 2,3-dioxygenase-like lactoylglutathione lyase family enzyme